MKASNSHLDYCENRCHSNHPATGISVSHFGGTLIPAFRRTKMCQIRFGANMGYRMNPFCPAPLASSTVGRPMQENIMKHLRAAKERL
jgi:hypothetical protein